MENINCKVWANPGGGEVVKKSSRNMGDKLSAKTNGARVGSNLWRNIFFDFFKGNFGETQTVTSPSIRYLFQSNRE